MIGRAVRQRVLAVASSGGHWVQLRKLAPVLELHDLAYVTVDETYRSEISKARFYSVSDATMWDKLGMIRLAVEMLIVVLRERPTVVISTGAAPGILALVWAKVLLGARTVWIDSIANSECLSASGRKAGYVADLWLTQWESVSTPEGPHYRGRVL